MLTRNHGSFIEQAIISIFNQKTNFSYELVIGDDFSTDNTTILIKKLCSEYPGRIRFRINEKNLGASYNASKTISECSGDYIAFCEGDDYWNDQLKLQKQVDFLESHPGYGMVHTGAEVVDRHNKTVYISNFPKPSGDIFKDILKSAFIITCTVCARADIMKKLASRVEKEKLWYTLDYWYWTQCAIESKIYFICEPTSSYRSHEQGVTRNNTLFFQERMPLMMLDIIKTRLEKRSGISMRLAYILSVSYTASLIARHVPLTEKKRYLGLMRKHPWLITGIIHSVIRKIFNRVKSIIFGEFRQ